MSGDTSDASLRRVRDSVDGRVPDFVARFPAIDPDVEGVVSRMAAIAKHISRAFDETLAGHGLNMGEYRLLVRLASRAGGEPMSAGELSRAQLLSSGAMTNRLDRLAAAGLVRRVPDPRDRRGVLVELTDQGRTAIDQAVTEQAAKEIDVLSVLTRNELGTLNKLLRKVLLSLETGAD
jgi:DNA-binding MarR family transcriptional regulator